MSTDPAIADSLRQWKLRTKYKQPDDWVFASPRTRGRLPYRANMLLKNYLQPAAKAARIEGCIGWHTFRRTFATLLVQHGNDVKVVQELLRHATSNVTLDFYAQAVTEAKRQAQSKIVRLIISKPARVAGEGRVTAASG